MLMRYFIICCVLMLWGCHTSFDDHLKHVKSRYNTFEDLPVNHFGDEQLRVDHIEKIFPKLLKKVDQNSFDKIVATSKIISNNQNVYYSEDYYLPTSTEKKKLLKVTYEVGLDLALTLISVNDE